MSKKSINSIHHIMNIFKTSEGGLQEKETKKTTFQKTLSMPG